MILCLDLGRLRSGRSGGFYIFWWSFQGEWRRDNRRDKRGFPDGEVWQTSRCRSRRPWSRGCCPQTGRPLQAGEWAAQLLGKRRILSFKTCWPHQPGQIDLCYDKDFFYSLTNFPVTVGALLWCGQSCSPFSPEPFEGAFALQSSSFCETYNALSRLQANVSSWQMDHRWQGRPSLMQHWNTLTSGGWFGYWNLRLRTNFSGRTT